MKDWGIDYFDLFLIHVPFTVEHVPIEKMWPTAYGINNLDGVKVLDNKCEYAETYKLMETLVDSGLARNIGMSNLSADQLKQVWDGARIKPAAI